MAHYVKFIDKNPNRKIKIGKYTFVSGQITVIHDINSLKSITKRKDMILISKDKYVQVQKNIQIQNQKQEKINEKEKKIAEKKAKEVEKKKKENQEKKKEYNKELRESLKKISENQETIDKIKNKLNSGNK